MTIPDGSRVTALYLGIGGTGGWGTAGQGLSPLFLHVTRPLASGAHDFTMRWVVPRSAGPRFLVAVYDPTPRPGHRESGGEVARSVAEFSVTSPAA
jgi:hypothetical protein